MSFLIGIIEDRETPPHQHKNYEIIVYVKGNGIFQADGKEIDSAPGKIIIVPPGCVHGAIRSDGLHRIYISGEFNQVFSLTEATVLLDNAEREGMLLANMIYNNRFAGSEYVAALINAFVHFLLRNLNSENPVGLKIKEIVSEITGNFYDCNLSLSDLLRKSGYAEDYIRACFRHFTGKTPTEFLTGVRISHACYLIDTYKNSLSLSEIAEKCGFTDYVYFSRRFKQIMGVSPQKYMSM